MSEHRCEWELVERCLHCGREHLREHEITSTPRDVQERCGFDLFDFLADPAHEGFVRMFADLLKGFDAQPWKRKSR